MDAVTDHENNCKIDDMHYDVMVVLLTIHIQ